MASVQEVAALQEALRAAKAQHESDAASQAAHTKAMEELESTLKVRSDPPWRERRWARPLT